MANREIEKVPFVKESFYTCLKNSEKSLHQFLLDHEKEINRTEKTINRWLHNGEAPKVIVQKIADILGVDVWYLTGVRDCSDAVVFTQELCRIRDYDLKRFRSILEIMMCNPKIAVDMVQDWSNEHPPYLKTDVKTERRKNND